MSYDMQHKRMLHSRVTFFCDILRNIFRIVPFMRLPGVAAGSNPLPMPRLILVLMHRRRTFLRLDILVVR